jgi:hypothetical protein
MSKEKGPAGFPILYLLDVPGPSEAHQTARPSVPSLIAEVRDLVMRTDSEILEILIRDGKLTEGQIEREPGSGRVFIKIADERMPLVAFMRRLYPHNASRHLPKSAN